MANPASKLALVAFLIAGTASAHSQNMPEIAWVSAPQQSVGLNVYDGISELMRCQTTGEPFGDTYKVTSCKLIGDHTMAEVMQVLWRQDQATNQRYADTMRWIMNDTRVKCRMPPKPHKKHRPLPR